MIIAKYCCDMNSGQPRNVKKPGGGDRELYIRYLLEAMEHDLERTATILRLSRGGTILELKRQILAALEPENELTD